MASSLEGNKIIAAVLTAGILASGAGVFSRILYAPETPEEPAYVVASAEAPAEGGEAEEAGPEPIAARLAAADVGAGEGAIRQCAACHTFEEGAGNRVGPALWGVVGREIGGLDDFNYSDALASLDDVWTYENLDGFLENPRDWAPGTSMSFAGISDAEQRADVILYLRSLAEEPEPLPEVEATETAEAAEAEEPAEAETAEAEEPAEAEAEAAPAGIEGFAAQVAAGDPSNGEQIAEQCTVCHTIEEGGGVLAGPPLWGVVGRDIASVEAFDYSDALLGLEGSWTYDKLAGYLRDPQAFAPGNIMGFQGIESDGNLADLIAYLRLQADEPEPLPESEEAAAAPAEEEPAEEAAASDEAATEEEEATTAEATGDAEAEAGTETAEAADEAAESEAAESEPAESEPAESEPAESEAADGFAAAVAAADPAAGETVARRCVACHSFEEGGANKVGPALWGVVGDDIAGVEGFNYSDALKELEGAWTYDKLAAYLRNPREFAPGNRMGFAGLQSEEDLANLIAYMRQQDSDPEPLPGE